MWSLLTLVAVHVSLRRVSDPLDLPQLSHPRTRMAALLLKNIPRGLDSELLNQYFFSRGGEVKEIQASDGLREAIVEFEDPSG